MSNILNYLSSGASYLIKNFELVNTGYDLFQGTLIHKGEKNPKDFEKLNELSTFFFFGDILMGSISFFQLTHLLNKKYKFEEIILRNKPDAFIPLNFALAISVAVVGALGTWILNKYYKPKLNLDSKDATWNRPFEEEIKQFMFISRLIMNIALFILSSYKITFAINSVIELYSLALVTKRKWIEIKKEQLINNEKLSRLANKIFCTYHFFLRSMKEKTTDDCAICLEKDPDSYFCSSHFFHADCIIKLINNKCETFGNNMILNDRKVKETKHYRNGIYTHSEYRATYYATAPHSNIPSCPLCRGTPDHNQMNIKINDLWYGMSEVIIDWKK